VSKNHNQPPSKKLLVNESKDKEKEAMIIAQNMDSLDQHKGRTNHGDIEKPSNPFNIKNELGKIRTLVPVEELVNNPIYQN
jgi:NAD-dependent SIR2 family protein deacetylase